MKLGALLVLTFICGYGDTACRTHNDCNQSLSSLSSQRSYCCGGTFCCTSEQYQQGLTTDPFLTMSVGGIVGIVVGMVAFFAALGIFIWCMFRRSGKRRLRPPKPKSSSTHLDNRPGYAIPTVSGSHYYDYPPDEESQGHKNLAYATSRFDRGDDFLPERNKRDGKYRQEDYHDAPTKGNPYNQPKQSYSEHRYHDTPTKGNPYNQPKQSYSKHRYHDTPTKGNPHNRPKQPYNEHRRRNDYPPEDCYDRSYRRDQYQAKSWDKALWSRGDYEGRRYRDEDVSDKRYHHSNDGRR